MGRTVRHRNGKSAAASSAVASNGASGGTAVIDDGRNTVLDSALLHHQQIKANRDRGSKSIIKPRTVLVFFLFVYYITKNLRKYVFPIGPAILTAPTNHAAIDKSNDLLQFRHNKTQKIITTSGDGIIGPETIVFGNDGTMYVLSENSYLVKVDQFEEAADGIHINSTTTLISDLGFGRPLGGKFTPKGNTLYICDAMLGLTRIKDVNDPRKKSKLEIVTRTVTDPNGTISRIDYANDVVVGPKTGKVYFTDATDIPPRRLYSWDSWDTLHTSKLDLVRGKAAGRLLQYDPKTDRTTILASNLKFANGIGIDKDETYLIFAETFGVNLWKYHLNNGTMEILVAGRDLPGYLDGVDCSWTTGLCYTAMPSAIVSMHHVLNLLPMWASQLVRTVMLLLPKWLYPRLKKFGGLVEVNPNTNEFRLLLDPTGSDIRMITGVTVYNNKLYLGSLSNKYIGVYDLQ